MARRFAALFGDGGALAGEVVGERLQADGGAAFVDRLRGFDIAIELSLPVPIEHGAVDLRAAFVESDAVGQAGGLGSGRVAGFHRLPQGAQKTTLQFGSAD